jgi:Fe-S cluster assembly protein SufD
MSAVIVEENTFRGAFTAASTQRRDEPSWLRRLREQSFERFAGLGFPTVDQEEWKYTNTAAIVKSGFTPVITANGLSLTNDELSSFGYEEARDTRLVFVNGFFRQEFSATGGLPEGVSAIPLTGVEGESDFARVVLERDAEGAANGFIALNSALFANGVLLKIPRGLTITKPIHLLFIADAENGTSPALFPRVIVDAGENSAATIIESFASVGDARYLTNSVVDFNLLSGARIQHYRLQRESASGFHVGTTRAELGSQATYEITSINLGGALSRHDIEVMMDHEGAECAVDGLYMVDGSQHTDTHSLIDHASAHCTSRQLYKGILDGKSRAVFNGKVFVRHGAQQTDAQQTNKNLLLSNEAHVDTKPQLEIFADDVKCAHGAAVGQLDDDEMFYLESRGINPALARNMLTYGFAEEVIAKIKVDSIKRELDEAVLNRLRTIL